MQEEKRIVKVGCPVVFHNEVGVAIDSLVTAVHGPTCINLVHVCTDPSMYDQYGRQIGRRSSCSHKSSTPAHGNYWRFADEEPNPIAAPLER